MLILLLALATSAPRPGELSTFHDWTVGCDNGRACQADALMPEDDFEAATMAVKRGAEAGSAPEVWITVREGEPASVAVDGRRFTLSPGSGEDEGSYWPEPASDFLRAVVRGKRAELLDAQGKPVAALSLAGAAAALLYMDDRQGRAGTVTALARPGPRPASAVPPAPALPEVIAAAASASPPRTLTAAQVKAARGDNACEDAGEEGEAESFRLDPQHSLALVPLRCGSGAYNFLSVALIVDERGRVTPARFDLQQWDDGGEGNLIYNSDWSAENRRLGTYFKGRGLGDCGTSQSYAWDGTQFRLVQQNEMGECRGSTDYIATWRARVVQR